MGLKVWLPLLNNTLNQGTGHLILVSGNPVYKTSGKIGAQALNLNSRITFDCPELANLQTFTIAFWGIAQNSSTLTSNWQDLLGFTDVSTGGSNGTFRWETTYSSTSGIHWHDNATNALVNGSHNHITVKEKWVHCCVVFNLQEGKLYSYDNGQLTQTHNHAGGKFNPNGRFYLGETNNIEGMIQDVRIYDHALSTAEVREISQGLVLHYKLDSIGPGFGNPNLLLEGMTPTAAGNGATGVVRSIENGIQKVVADNPNSNWCTFGNHNTTLTLTKGDTFTFSLMIRSPDSDKKPTVYFQSGLGYYGMQGTMSNNWSIIYYTGTWSIDNLQTNIHLGFSSAPGTYYIKYFKLEKGGSVTPWAPKEGEALSDLKYIEDSSGYNHNGTILNTVSISSDTPRYSCSTKLEAANSMINCGRGGMMTDSITVNMWIKSSAWANPVSCTESGGWNFEGTGNYFRFPVYVSGVGYKYGQSSTTKAQICNNEWHMLTGIYDRINQKIQIYVDGKLDNDYATGTSNNIGYHGSNCIWIGAEATGSNTTASNGMAGLFSDFRIYCTALDADAIRQLYEVGAKIDDKQNLHTFELDEANSGRELISWNYTTSYGNHTNVWNNYDENGEITLTGGSSLGSDYIKINPSGKKYYFDADISVDANNQVYIGFQRYDASKTSRSNDATVYSIAIKPSTALVHQHYHIIYDATSGTSNFGFFDANTPVDTISVRILNDWSNANSRKMAVHRLSLREVSTLQNSKINKRGQVITDELIEMDSGCRIQKNGIIEANEIIEL